MRSAITVAKETQGSDHDPNALVNPASVGRESAIESRRKEEITMDTKGFVVPPGQGPVWNMAPGRSATLKLQSGETAESVMMFEEAAPSGTVTNFHLHRDSDEVAYVLSGEVTFKIGDQVIVGGPGTCAFIPRGVAHAWKSTGAETGRVLFIFTPAEAGKAFEELQQLQCPVGSMAAPVFQRHGAEVVGPPPF
jgi:quercetin dioxygenase-like cupin family protein